MKAPGRVAFAAVTGERNEMDGLLPPFRFRFVPSCPEPIQTTGQRPGGISGARRPRK